MKFYLISIQFLRDETNPIGIYAYDSREEVLSAYHSTLASNYINNNLKSFCVMVITEFGKTEYKEYYASPNQEVVNE